MNLPDLYVFYKLLLMGASVVVFAKWFIVYVGTTAIDIMKGVFGEYIDAIAKRKWNPGSLNALGMTGAIALAAGFGVIVNSMMGESVQAVVELAVVLLVGLAIVILGFVACVWLVVSMGKA